MTYVLRKLHAPGKSAHADEATVQALARAAIEGTLQYGDYLEWFDPDANGGLGDDRWTSDVHRAKQFTTFAAAMECWKMQSRARPWRDDGEPNRPLTAYSLMAERVA